MPYQKGPQIGQWPLADFIHREGASEVCREMTSRMVHPLFLDVTGGNNGEELIEANDVSLAHKV